LRDDAHRAQRPARVRDRLAYLADDDRNLPDGAMEQVREHVARLEQATGKGFGDPDDPLLVSVRSGSALSMPGWTPF
jgi:pyruvate,orthophosphate dikinase